MSADRSKTRNSKKEDSKCGKCDKEVGKKDQALTCDLCGMWHHTVCEGVEEALYKLMQETQKLDQGIKWFCKKCNKFACGLMSNITQISARQDAIESKVHVFEQEIKGLNNILSTFKEEQDKINKQVSDKLTETANKCGVSASTREVREREERKANLIFFNIEESSKEETTERIQDDIEKIKKVLEKIEAGQCELNNPVRLGKKGEQPRPLKVKLQSNDACQQILRQTKKLKGTDTYISRDMTPLERKEWKELLEERNKRRKEAEKKGEEEIWVIRKGKVVNVAREGGRQSQGAAEVA